MPPPLTREEFLRHIAAETARMSYPGSMSRGKRPVVFGGTKAQVERYFVVQFPLAHVWDKPREIAQTFDTWHQEQSHAIAKQIEQLVASYHNSIAVGTKFLNTFLHQLMKYEPCRVLWKCLHLPLDSRVFQALAKLQPTSLSAIRHYFLQSPYTLDYTGYITIRKALNSYLDELNSRPGNGMRLTSRIELNWLWI
jgi:hypothetical protein